MRLDEWQKYIESEFLEEKPSQHKATLPPLKALEDSNAFLAEAVVVDISRDANLKEEANETPSMRLKRRRNLTSANIVTHFEIPSFPVGESGRVEPMYALLRSQSPIESSGIEDIQAEGNVRPPSSTDFPLNQSDNSRDETFDELRTGAYKAVVRVQARPLPKVNDGLSIEIPTKLSSQSVSEMPSIDRYLPGMSALSGHNEVPEVVVDACEEKSHARKRRQFQSALNLGTNRDEISTTKAEMGRLPVLQVLNRLTQEDALRPMHSQTLTGDRLATLERLLNPELTLDETALLLDISTTTVRRYTNQGILKHFRKGMEGADSEEMNSFKTRQRRFRLLDVLEFFEERLKK